MIQTWKTILAFAIGVSISAVGYFLTVNEDIALPTIVRMIGAFFSALFIPGLFVGLLTGSNVHDPNMLIAFIANSLLYGFILRLIFKKSWKGDLTNGTEE
ncbi:MAG TPA: hypothetical protein VGH38_11440 [Bryobacteraceae bacterium]|jgi:hypothetical protein